MAFQYTSLLETAGRLAKAHNASVPAVIKELLHYEILQALVESGVADNLVFQGGTALRLCHGGVRYSEDLDFAGGVNFDPAQMAPFVRELEKTAGRHYGLHMEVEAHLPDPHDKVPVARWKAKIRLPDVSRDAKQSYFIHTEVASIPAHTSVVAVARSSVIEVMPQSYRAIALKTETKEEIFADKLIALGARTYVKQRDLWDIHMLVQGGVTPRDDLVWRKMADYGLDFTAFLQRLSARADQLNGAEAKRAFREEMLRFLDAPKQRLLADDAVVDGLLSVVEQSARRAIRSLREHPAHLVPAVDGTIRSNPRSDARAITSIAAYHVELGHLSRDIEAFNKYPEVMKAFQNSDKYGISINIALQMLFDQHPKLGNMFQRLQGRVMALPDQMILTSKTMQALSTQQRSAAQAALQKDVDVIYRLCERWPSVGIDSKLGQMTSTPTVTRGKP